MQLLAAPVLLNCFNPFFCCRSLNLLTGNLPLRNQSGFHPQLRQYISLEQQPYPDHCNNQ
jgi:hypothetical protein